MTMRQIKTVRRGRYYQLAYEDDGKSVEATLTGDMTVKKAFATADGKRYLKLDLDRAIGDKKLLMDVQEHIERAVSPRYSPLRNAWSDVTVKLMGAHHDEFAVGDVLDSLVVSPGAFETFGWCLLAKRTAKKSTVQPS